MYDMPTQVYPLKLYLSRLPIVATISIALVINLGIWVAFFLMIPYRESQVFLHYTVLFGVDYIDTGWRIFGIPLFGLCILLANVTIGWLLFQKDRFVGYVLCASAGLMQCFLAVTSILLIFLNG